MGLFFVCHRNTVCMRLFYEKVKTQLKEACWENLLSRGHSMVECVKTCIGHLSSTCEGLSLCLHPIASHLPIDCFGERILLY